MERSMKKKNKVEIRDMIQTVSPSFYNENEEKLNI